MEEKNKPCYHSWCIALAMPGQSVCVIHRQFPNYRPTPKIRTLQRLYEEEAEASDSDS